MLVRVAWTFTVACGCISPSKFLKNWKLKSAATFFTWVYTYPTYVPRYVLFRWYKLKNKRVLELLKQFNTFNSYVVMVSPTWNTSGWTTMNKDFLQTSKTSLLWVIPTYVPYNYLPPSCTYNSPVDTTRMLGTRRLTSSPYLSTDMPLSC